ncbi:MAG: hypothetical protein ACJ779_02865 [Chloroflexota bacterium]
MTLRGVALAISIALAVMACGSGASATTAPSRSAAPTPTATPNLPTIAPTPSIAPTPTATALAPASASASASAACVFDSQTGLLPSDRLTNVEILGAPGRDVIRFSFGKRSLGAGAAGPATGTLDAARPPFTQAASGEPIDLQGEHALKVVFSGMSLQNDAGEPAYDGPREFTGTDPSRSLRHVVQFDESEGLSGWYIGYDGPSCATLTRSGDSVEIALDFGPGS